MTLSSLSLPGLFFSLSLPGLARQSKDIRHLLTICTQKASRSNKGSRRSRSCGQAGNSLSLPGLFFSLSLPGLARQSKDIRHLLTICTQKASRSNKGSRRSRSCGQAGNSLSLPGLFFSLSLPGLARQSKDIRHLLTICTQKASRSNKGSRRSRSCGQAGNSLSLPGLARQSNYDP